MSAPPAPKPEAAPAVHRPLEIYLTQLTELARSEWKLQQQSSLGGFLWTLLEPALMYAVLYWLFTQWSRGSTPHYAALLVIGVVQYGFFQKATTYAMTSPVRRRGLMANFVIKREILVFSAILSVAMSYLLELALMMVFIAGTGTPLTAAWTLLPLLAAAQILFVMGLSLPLAVLAARYSDFERIWGILTYAGYFLTPIFYTLESLDASRRRVVGLSPVAQLIELMRDCLVRGQPPSAGRLAAVFLLCAALLLAGYAFFKRHADRLSDYVSL